MSSILKLFQAARQVLATARSGEAQACGAALDALGVAVSAATLPSEDPASLAAELLPLVRHIYPQQLGRLVYVVDADGQVSVGTLKRISLEFDDLAGASTQHHVCISAPGHMPRIVTARHVYSTPDAAFADSDREAIAA